MNRCKHCSSIVPEGSEVCKACGKPLYEAAEEDKPRRRNPQISMGVWWVIIGVSIVIGFVSYIGRQKRQDEMEQALADMEESTQMIQAVQASIPKIDSEMEMPEISYEDMKLSYAPGQFSLNEKNSKLDVKYYESEDKMEMFVISMTYADAATDVTQNYIENVGEAYYVYIESMTTDNNGFTKGIEEVLESIEIVEK